MDGIAATPRAPYWAVVFSSQRERADDGYDHMSDRMVDLAKEQDGFLGLESARDAAGFGITVSYWESEEAIARWRAHAEHQAAQRGAVDWYERYQVRVARVERSYGG